jgi:hypothetical protein
MVSACTSKLRTVSAAVNHLISNDWYFAVTLERRPSICIVYGVDKVAQLSIAMMGETEAGQPVLTTKRPAAIPLRRGAIGSLRSQERRTRMASYRGHLAFASVLGVGYGTVGAWGFRLDWGPVFLSAGLTTVGGLLPDLDSDTGVPIRELFGLAASLTPLLVQARVHEFGFSPEQSVVLLAGLYVLIRYGLRAVFERLTVHRGMFHSLPAMAITGLAVYLLHPGPERVVRLYLSGAAMIGFLSHLVLDELCSVNLMGVRLRLTKYAGSAVKLVSPSWPATMAAYGVLAGLVYLVHLDGGW